MLQKLNERIQGLVAWLVIILIAITFTLFGVDYYMQSHHATNAKVMVNGNTISTQDYDLTYRRARGQRDPASLTAETEKRLQQQVLQGLIRNEVILQAAKKDGFDVSVEMANSAIVGIPQFQEEGHFSAEKYQQMINGAYFTPETFQKEVRQGMILNQQRFVFMGTSFALPDELKRFVRLYMQTRDYNYLVIPAAEFVQDIKVNDKEIKAYYQQHTAEFKTPEQVSVEYLQLAMPEVRKSIQLSEEELKRYYDDNENNYLTPAQWRVAHILLAKPANATPAQMDDLKKQADEAYQALTNNPQQFTQMVKTMSADKISVTENGELPWITAGQSGFDQALAKLDQPNQISKPLLTQHGYEIFKLIEYKPAHTRPFTAVKNEIEAQLLADKVQNEFSHLSEQLADLTYQTPDSLEPAAKALKLNIQTTTPFSRKGGKDDFTASKQVVNTAFSHDVLTLSNNSEIIQLDNDSVVVLRVKEHQPAMQIPLAEVKAQIIQAIKVKQASKNAQAFAERLMKEKPEVQAKLISDRKWQWRKAQKAGREDPAVDPLINSLAFTLPKAKDLTGEVLANGDYALVQLTQINPGIVDDLDVEQRRGIEQQIEANFGIMEYDLYVNSLLKQAKVEVP